MPKYVNKQLTGLFLGGKSLSLQCLRGHFDHFKGDRLGKNYIAFCKGKDLIHVQFNFFSILALRCWGHPYYTVPFFAFRLEGFQNYAEIFHRNIVTRKIVRPKKTAQGFKKRHTKARYIVQLCIGRLLFSRLPFLREFFYHAWHS